MIVRIFAVMVFLMITTLLALAQTRQAAPPAKAPATTAQSPGKQLKRDEVFFSIGRLINSKNESPVSAISAEVDGAIEVTDIAYRPDGKAEVTVKERTPSSASFTNRSGRLLFAPPATGDQWTLIEFEENRRFYPIDRLFPFVQAELAKRKQMTDASWNNFWATVGKQGESATALLETVKAVLKAEMPMAQPVLAARKALAEAMKENKVEEMLAAYNDLLAQNESINSLGDTYSDLKANDGYLRLQEGFKNAVNVANVARKNYVQTVDAYNESLVRLPFAYLAYGLQFTKIEAKLTAE